MSCNIYQEAVWIRMAYKTITMLCHSIMSFRNSVHIVCFFFTIVFLSLSHTERIDKRYIWAITHCFVNSYSVMPKRMSGLWESLVRALLLLCFWTCKYRNKCTSRCKCFPFVSLVLCCKFHAISYTQQKVIFLLRKTFLDSRNYFLKIRKIFLNKKKNLKRIKYFCGKKLFLKIRKYFCGNKLFLIIRIVFLNQK